MRAVDVEPGDRLAGVEVEAVWSPVPGWRSIQTVDGAVAFLEDGAPVDGTSSGQGRLELGVAFAAPVAGEGW